MTEEEILSVGKAALKKWQRRLHLGGWKLGLSVTTDLGGDDEGVCGELRGNWWHETGTILVHAAAPDKHRQSDSAWPDETDEQIVERIVLHELLHVAERPMHDVADREFRCYFGKDGGAFALESARHAWWAAREMRINRMARVLIEADRSGGWGKA